MLKEVCSMMTTKKWIVTGSSGYLGSNLLSLNHQKLHDAILIDNRNINSQDFGDTSMLKKLIEDVEIEGVIHLAALKSLSESYEKEKEYIENNFKKSVILYEMIRDLGLKKFIFASSAAVYSSPEKRVLVSETDPVLPISPYGLSKLMFEEYLETRPKDHVDTFSLRFFNLAGGNKKVSSAGGAVNLIAKYIKTGKVFTVNGGLTGPKSSLFSIRDYIGVIDASKAIIKCLEYSNPHFFGNYNVCTGSESMLKDIIEIAQQEAGIPLKVSSASQATKEVSWMVGSNAKFQKTFNWKPDLNINEIIRQALECQN